MPQKVHGTNDSEMQFKSKSVPLFHNHDHTIKKKTS